MKSALYFAIVAILTIATGLLASKESIVITDEAVSLQTSISNQTQSDTSTSFDVIDIQQNSNLQQNTDFRAFWVATVYNLDYPLKQTTDAETLKKQAIEILDYAKANGYNAVIFQARPAADSFYNSQYFPWSRFLTGEQGVAPQNSFDPLDFFVTEAHKRGLELHAWLNPYRVTKKDSGDTRDDFATLADSHPAKIHPEWTVKYSDGNLYFNPGIPEVRELIVNSIIEIVQNYDIDGVHFDDYFYPGAVFNDADTFEKYGKDFESVDDFRRANVDILVKTAGEEIEKIKPNCSFGISPFGIWANIDTNPLGSDTKGTQSYYDHYADTRKWVKEGYIDYIAPQLYWNIGHKTADYQKLLDWWIDVVKDTDVKLYIGQAAYRAGDSDQNSAWFGTSEIENQLKMNLESKNVDGSIFFRYQFLKANSELTDAIYTFYKTADSGSVEVAGGNSQSLGSQVEQDDTQSKNVDSSDNGEQQTSENFMLPKEELQKLSIARPASDISTTYEKFYITGGSNPEYPLFINGEEVTDRSAQGFYGMLVTLSDGDNKITVEQNGQTVSRNIYKGVKSASVSQMEKAEIIKSSVFPQNEEYRQVGEKITLKCTAPAGATVTVKINGSTYTMKSSSAKRTDGKIVSASYTYSYTIPKVDGNAEIISLGKPVYKMTYNGKTDTKTAPYEIKVILKNAPFYANITADVADTKVSNTSTGFDSFLYKGMRAAITGMTGNYVRIGQDCWVSKSDVKTEMLKETQYPVITKPQYIFGNEYDKIIFTSSQKTSAIASFDGEKFTVKVAPALRAENIQLPNGAIFKSSEIESGSGYEKYIFTLSDSATFDGYYIETTQTGFNLYIKHRKKVSSGEKPLSNIKIVVDAGHGGDDNGAVGCMGNVIAEKDINFVMSKMVAQKLTELGAEVIMTRTEDKYITLQKRQQISFGEKPDLFLSIHANSLNDNVDISKVEGLCVFYKNEISANFAKTLFDTTKFELSREDRGLQQSNLYVARASWTPSIIYESGFIPNPHDFEWLISEKGQQDLANSIVNSIVKYFS